MVCARLQRKQSIEKPNVGDAAKRRVTVGAISRRPLSFNDTTSSALRLHPGVGPSTTFLPHSLQAKLTINQPGDQYEQEADRVAEQVMRMPDPAVRLQRKCACGGSIGLAESHEKCASQSVQLQRSARTEHGSPTTTTPSIVHDVLRSPGQALDASTRSFFEHQFDHDFSRVRVHIDARAVESAQAVNALAYTVGNNVIFGARQYAPRTTEGRRLLAHELTHVVQNRGAAPTMIRRDPPRPTSPSPVDVNFNTFRNGEQVSDPTGRSHGIRIERRGNDLFYHLPGVAAARRVPRPRPRGPRGTLLAPLAIQSVTWGLGRSSQDAFTATFSGSLLADSFTVNVHGFGRYTSLANFFAEEDIPLEVNPEGLEIERQRGILVQPRPGARRFRDAQHYHMPGALFSLYVLPTRDVVVADDATGQALWRMEARDLEDLQVSARGNVRAVFHDSGGSFGVTFNLDRPSFIPAALGSETPSPERATLLAAIRAAGVLVIERGARFSVDELRAARDVIAGWRGSTPLLQAAVFGLRLIKDVSTGSAFYNLGEVHIPGTSVESPTIQRGTIIHELAHALFAAARLQPRQPGVGFSADVMQHAAELEAASATGAIDEGAVEHHQRGAALRRPIQRGGRNPGWAERLSSSPELNFIWNHFHNRFPIDDPEGTGDIRGLDVADESRYLRSARGDVVGHGFDSVTEFIASFVSSSLEHQAAMSETIRRSRSLELAHNYQDLWSWVNSRLISLGRVNPYDAIVTELRAAAVAPARP